MFLKLLRRRSGRRRISNRRNPPIFRTSPTGCSADSRTARLISRPPAAVHFVGRYPPGGRTERGRCVMENKRQSTRQPRGDHRFRIRVETISTLPSSRVGSFLRRIALPVSPGCAGRLRCLGREPPIPVTAPGEDAGQTSRRTWRHRTASSASRACRRDERPI